MKSNTKKRLIAFMLCMVLVLSSTISAFADDLDTQAQDQTTTMADEPVATSMDDSTDEQQPVAEAETEQLLSAVCTPVHTLLKKRAHQTATLLQKIPGQ